MKCIMVAAISEDGFIASADNPDPYSWTSDEDKKFFKDILSKHKLRVMGINTYEVNKPGASEGVMRVVLTNRPEKYKSIAGKLEFVKLTPHQFVNKYIEHDTCLVLGGSFVFEDFLKSNLIDEIYLTIEPFNIHKGVKLLAHEKKLDEIIKLPKYKEKILNKRGTLLRHYILKK